MAFVEEKEQDIARVAKCQFFYTDNFCPTKFTLQKGRKLRQVFDI